MVLQKPWVSQNFRRNSRVSQTRVFNGCVSHSLYFFTNLSRRIDGFSRLRKPRSTDLFILLMNLNYNVGTSQARIKTIRNLGLTSEEVKMSRARKEKR